MAAGEAFFDGTRARGRKDLGEGGLKEVAKGDIALAIQATGHDRAVNEDAKVVGKAVAKDIFPAVGCVSVGPCEAVAPLNVELFADAHASCVFRPFARKTVAEEI